MSKLTVLFAIFIYKYNWVALKLCSTINKLMVIFFECGCHLLITTPSFWKPDWVQDKIIYFIIEPPVDSLQVLSVCMILS